ncbi:MAG: hypothetical protein AAF465_04835 [Pseudomonadota bacterium]
MSIDYGIEWAYGEFRIARLKGKAVVEIWKSPTPVTDLTSLSAAMYEACHRIDISRGGTVAIAYEDDFHTHEFLEIPPLSTRDLRKYLTRHVTNNKPFDGEASWRHHPVKRATGNDGVLLHLMPKDIVEAVIRICEEFYLKPRLLVPLTEIMSEYVPLLEADVGDEAILLIALFDERTQMLVSNGDGEILFVRELSYPWNESTVDRLAMDVNRTIGYAKQRIGGKIEKAWLIGDRASIALSELVQKIDVEVGFDPIAATPSFWMVQVAQLPQGLASNFIPRLARRSITSKTLLRGAVMMSAVASIAALSISAVIEYSLYKYRTDSEELRYHISDLNDELDQLNSEIARMDVEKTKLDLLNVDAFNLPALFMSHLGEMVPEGLVLESAQVNRSGDTWEVALLGTSVVALGDVAPLLESLQSKLSSDPWNTAITVSWEKSWMQQLQQGRAAESGDVGFEIRGNFR